MCGKVLTLRRNLSSWKWFKTTAGAIEEHHGMVHYQKVRAALVDLQDKPRLHDSGYTVIYSK
jgi:hypothetical protein